MPPSYKKRRTSADADSDDAGAQYFNAVFGGAGAKKIQGKDLKELYAVFRAELARRRPNLGAVTLRTYTSLISRMYVELGGTGKVRYFYTHTDVVVAHLSTLWSAYSRKNRIGALNALTDGSVQAYMDMRRSNDLEFITMNPRKGAAIHQVAQELQRWYFEDALAERHPTMAPEHYKAYAVILTTMYAKMRGTAGIEHFRNRAADVCSFLATRNYCRTRLDDVAKHRAQYYAAALLTGEQLYLTEAKKHKIIPPKKAAAANKKKSSDDDDDDAPQTIISDLDASLPSFDTVSSSTAASSSFVDASFDF